MKYVLMFADHVEDQQMWEKMPKDQMAAAYEPVNKWFEDHSKTGQIVGGEELLGPSSSTTVRFKNGKPIVTDGPFIEAGYHLFHAARADLLDRVSEPLLARQARLRALELCQNPAERSLLERKLGRAPGA
jgi:hypothetical protein